MKKSKRSEPPGPDRLSELPDSVLFHILWFVPMFDVIRTTVLSKRWRNLCTTTPYLNFVTREQDEYDENGNRYYDDHFTNQFRNQVNRALMFWNGERILKFKVDSSDSLKSSINDDIDMWLRFAKKNEVEELYLHLHCASISSVAEDFSFESVEDQDHVYWVTGTLGSCQSLKELSFRQCSFDINKNVQWNLLTRLTIAESLNITEDDVNRILSGSPRLEVFILSYADRGESLSIHSTSLKELSIYKFIFDRMYYDIRYAAPNGELWMGTKLDIRAPNLELLEIKGIPFGHYVLNDVSSLTHATLGCSGLHHFYKDHEFALTTSDFLGDKYSLILPSLQHVEHITLQYCCIKVLGAMKKRCLSSSFPNVKSLQVGYCFNDYEQLAALLESFPQLKTLVLHVRDEDEYHDKSDSLKLDSKSCLKYCEAIRPDSFLLQLKTVEVTWAEDDSIFPFIEIVLKYARKLEKVVFRVQRFQLNYPLSKYMLLASQELLRMPRSSPNCTIRTIPYIPKW